MFLSPYAPVFIDWFGTSRLQEAVLLRLYRFFSNSRKAPFPWHAGSFRLPQRSCTSFAISISLVTPPFRLLCLSRLCRFAGLLLRNANVRAHWQCMRDSARTCRICDHLHRRSVAFLNPVPALPMSAMRTPFKRTDERSLLSCVFREHLVLMVVCSHRGFPVVSEVWALCGLICMASLLNATTFVLPK